MPDAFFNGDPTMPSGDFAIGDDRVARQRPRRACQVVPSLHTIGGIPIDEPRTEAALVGAALRRDLPDPGRRQLVAVIDPLPDINDPALNIPTIVRRKSAASIEQAVTNLTREAAAITCATRAIRDAGHDDSTAVHFARIVVEALAADGLLG